MPMPELTSDMSSLVNLSPVKVARVGAVRLYEQYFDHMTLTHGLDGATVAMIILCTEPAKRKSFWDTYIKIRDDERSEHTQESRLLSASVQSIGDLYSYMSSAMGLSEDDIPLDVIDSEFNANTIASYSPKGIVCLLFLRSYEKYCKFLATKYGTDGATAAMFISCKDKVARDRLWDKYLDEREKSDILTASVFTIGDWYSEMSIALGLTEESTMGG